MSTKRKNSLVLIIIFILYNIFILSELWKFIIPNMPIRFLPLIMVSYIFINITLFIFVLINEWDSQKADITWVGAISIFVFLALTLSVSFVGEKGGLSFQNRAYHLGMIDRGVSISEGDIVHEFFINYDDRINKYIGETNLDSDFELPRNIILLIFDAQDPISAHVYESIGFRRNQRGDSINSNRDRTMYFELRDRSNFQIIFVTNQTYSQLKDIGVTNIPSIILITRDDIFINSLINENRVLNRNSVIEMIEMYEKNIENIKLHGGENYNIELIYEL